MKGEIHSSTRLPQWLPGGAAAPEGSAPPTLDSSVAKLPNAPLP